MRSLGISRKGSKFEYLGLPAILAVLLSFGFVTFPVAFAFDENADLDSNGITDVVVKGDFVTGPGIGTQEGNVGDFFVVSIRNDDPNPFTNVTGEVFVLAPNGDVLFTGFYNLPSGSSFTSSQIEATQPGSYTVRYEPCIVVAVSNEPLFCGTIEPSSGQMNASFFVIPESPIGIIALIVSSLGVFGGFMFWRRKQSSNSQPHSLGDLGI